MNTGRELMASNDNHDPEFGLVESIIVATHRWAVVEYDSLGPILRLGPFERQEHAKEALRDYREMRRLEFELRHRGRGRR